MTMPGRWRWVLRAASLAGVAATGVAGAVACSDATLGHDGDGDGDRDGSRRDATDAGAIPRNAGGDRPEDAGAAPEVVRGDSALGNRDGPGGGLSDGEADADEVVLIAHCVPTPAQPCVAELALGDAHSCARLSDGTVRCWGRYGAGLLGIGVLAGATPATVVAVPTRVVGIDDAVRVAAGAQHTCVVRQSGEVWCWGNNTFGRLGNGATDIARSPVRVELASGASEVVLGRDSTCALVSGGVACWGSNEHGQLGVPEDAGAASVPVTTSLRDVVGIAAGGQHACARLASGSVTCWGGDSEGQLGAGDGAWLFNRPPTSVLGVTRAIAIGGGQAHTCVLEAGGQLLCFGDNGSRQLGVGLDATGATVLKTDLPARALHLPDDVVELALGARFTCARRRVGKVLCWGDNSEYQLGDTGGTASTPVEVDGITTAIGLAAGAGHVCARLADGSAMCWGGNASGQAGAPAPAHDADGGGVDRVARPTPLRW